MHVHNAEEQYQEQEIIHVFSGTGICCPVHATAHRIKYLRLKGVKCTVPIASIYIRNMRTAIKAKQIADTVRQAMIVNFHNTGISPDEESACSLRDGGTMALLCRKVDKNIIHMRVRWHSDAMIRYLHMQAQPIIQHVAGKMYNNGTYSFIPNETAPLLYDDANDDE
jgi:hypothetical protein